MERGRHPGPGGGRGLGWWKRQRKRGNENNGENEWEKYCMCVCIFVSVHACACVVSIPVCILVSVCVYFSMLVQICVCLYPCVCVLSRKERENVLHDCYQARPEAHSPMTAEKQKRPATPAQSLSVIIFQRGGNSAVNPWCYGSLYFNWPGQSRALFQPSSTSLGCSPQSCDKSEAICYPSN